MAATLALRFCTSSNIYNISLCRISVHASSYFMQNVNNILSSKLFFSKFTTND